MFFNRAMSQDLPPSPIRLVLMLSNITTAILLILFSLHKSLQITFYVSVGLSDVVFSAVFRASFLNMP
jgi:hypothetical protein